MRILLIGLIFIMSPISHAEGIRFGFGFGNGDIQISSKYDTRAGDSSVASIVRVGYVSANNVTFELGYSAITDDLLFGANDNVHLDSFEALIGYEFRSGSFRFEPQIGYARWELELNEGAFLNPGPEERSSSDGSDPLLSVSAGYDFTKVFGMSLSYKYLDFQYGEAKSVILGFDFQY